MLDLVNQERAKAGCQALQMDQTWSNWPQDESPGYDRQGVFQPSSPTYGSSRYDENIRIMAAATPVKIRPGAQRDQRPYKFDELSGPPGQHPQHRNYTKVGTVWSTADHGKMFVQLFIG